MSLTTNLQAFYKLSDLTDSSGNSRVLTNVGNVSFTSGKIGNAALFNGTNRLYTDSFSTIDTSQPFCISFWSKPTTNTVGSVCANGNGVGFNIHNDGAGSLNFNNGQSGDCTVPDAFVVGVWKHYVCIISNGFTVVYINGSQVYNEPSGVSYSATINSLSIGSYVDNQLMFDGQIDAVGVWSRALTEAEVTELYNGGTGLELEGVGSVNLTTGLQAFYKLSDLTDSSGNNKTLINNGNVQFASGKIGNAAVFDGSNYLTAQSVPVVGTSDMSVGMWLNLNNFNSNPPVTFTGGPGGFSMGLFEGIVLISHCSVADLHSFSSGAVTSNSWFHVLVKRVDSVFTCYVNGSSVGTYDSGSVIDFTGTDYTIGAHPGPMLFADGQMDAVGIWNRALSEAEVAELYNSGAGLELGSEGNNYNSYFSIAKIQGKSIFTGNVKFIDPMGYNS